MTHSVTNNATRFRLRWFELQLSVRKEIVARNRLLATATLAASSLLLRACETSKYTRPSGLVVSDVTVLSPERAAPLAHAYVRIVNGKIVEVSERPLRGARQIDGTGRYLIPGLIDSNVHLAVSPGYPAAMTAE